MEIYVLNTFTDKKEAVETSDEVATFIKRADWREDKAIASKKKREMTFTDIEADGVNPVECSEIISTVGNPEDELLKSELKAAMDNAIAQLPAKQMIVIRMMIAELSTKEIAAKLGVSVQAVNKTKRHAFGNLRAILWDYCVAYHLLS